MVPLVIHQSIPKEKGLQGIKECHQLSIQVYVALEVVSQTWVVLQCPKISRSVRFLIALNFFSKVVRSKEFTRWPKNLILR